MIDKVLKLGDRVVCRESHGTVDDILVQREATDLYLIAWDDLPDRDLYHQSELEAEVLDTDFCQGCPHNYRCCANEDHGSDR